MKLLKKLGGSLDGIINNAGITKDNLTIRMSLEEWTKVIDINFNFYLFNVQIFY